MLLNWKIGSYPRQSNVFSTVNPPSPNLTRFDGQNFSLNLPDNWLLVSQTTTEIWFAPNGGYFNRQNRNQYGYAVSVGIVPIAVNDLSTESEKFYRSIISANDYLEEQQSSPKTTFMSGRKASVASFAGFNIETGQEEFIKIHTSFTRDGNLFYVLTVIPFEKRREYQRAFDAILSSIKF